MACLRPVRNSVTGASFAELGRLGRGHGQEMGHHRGQSGLGRTLSIMLRIRALGWRFLNTFPLTLWKIWWKLWTFSSPKVHRHTVSGLNGSEAHCCSWSSAVGKPQKVLSRNVTLRWRVEFQLFHSCLWLWWQLCAGCPSPQPTLEFSGKEVTVLGELWHVLTLAVVPPVTYTQA